MRRLVLGGAALVAVSVLGLVVPWRAGAQAVEVGVTAVGWWSSNPVAVAQPEGGFQVAAGPDGSTQSLAAVRLSIAATHVDSLPVHLVESSSVGTDFGILRMCTTKDAWTAANPGTMDSAPKPDCSVSASLTRTVDGSWLGDAAALAPDGGDVSLMVVPVFQPPSPAPIGPGLIVTISGGQFTATGSNVTSTTASTVDSSSVGSGSDGSTIDYFGTSGGGSFGIPDSTITPSFGSVAPPPEQVAAPSRSTTNGFALTPVKSDGGPATPWIRLIILLPLSAGVGVGAARLRRAIAEGLLPFG